MNRWLPYPLHSVALAAMWLMLNGSLAPAHLLLAVLLGWAGGVALATLQAPLGGARHRRAGTAIILATLLLADIVRSNVAVARIVFKPRNGRTPGFVSV